MISKEYVEYEGFKCLKITNGKTICLVTVDVGPRIIYYGFADKNILFVDKNRKIFKEGEFFDKNYKEGERWFIYGGHRLWKSEEDLYTYNCDNYPVDVQYTGFGASFKNGTQKCTSLAFELEVNMNEDGSLAVIHKITNLGKSDKKLAAWGITILTGGGVEIIPMPSNDTKFLPNRNLSIWAYTDMSDKRISFLGKYLKLKQLSDNPNPLKLGLKNNDGFGFYVADKLLFTKKTDYAQDGVYPDGGCNYETYTSDIIMELETLSPLKNLKPAETITYIENWNIKNIDTTPNFETEKEIDDFIKKYVF